MDNVTLAIASARDNPYSAKSCVWAGSVLVRPDSPEQYKAFGEELLRQTQPIELYPNYGEAYFESGQDRRRLQQHLATSLIYLAHAALVAPAKAISAPGLDAIKPDLLDHTPDSYMPELLQNAADHPTEASPQLALAVAAYAHGDLPEAEDIAPPR